MRRGDLDSSDEIHLLKRGGPSAPRPAGPRPRDPRVCGQAELRQELTSEPRQLKAAHVSLDGFARLLFFPFLQNMYLCRRCEAGRSQSPLEAPDCEAKRVAAAAAAHFPTWLEKFAERVDELTRSPASLPPVPRSRRPRSSGRATPAPAHRTPRASPPAWGRARHVLPTVWIPLLLGTPGKEAPGARHAGERAGLSANLMSFPI